MGTGKGSISIHAPTRGATISFLIFCDLNQDFNPRSHKGSDGDIDFGSYLYIPFQSTLPQGERRKGSIKGRAYTNFNPRSHKGSDFKLGVADDDTVISIHAPTRGATLRLGSTRLADKFQSTLPQGERPASNDKIFNCAIISIHAPTRGATWTGC